MTNYKIIKEYELSLFMSPLTGAMYVITNGFVSSVYTKRGKYLLSDLGGIDFLNNLTYIGEV